MLIGSYVVSTRQLRGLVEGLNTLTELTPVRMPPQNVMLTPVRMPPQNVIMYEYLPAFLGDAVDSYQGYRPDVHPGISHVFQSAAFR